MEGDTLPAEVNDVTKNAVMWLYYCLDAEKGDTLLSNVQTPPIKPTGGRKGNTAISKANCNTSGGGGWKSSTKLWKEKIRLKIVSGKG